MSSFSGMILIYVCIHYICVYRYLYTLYIDLQRKNNQIVSDFLSANLAAAGNQFRVITDNWEKTIHSPYIIHLSEKKKKTFTDMQESREYPNYFIWEYS